MDLLNLIILESSNSESELDEINLRISRKIIRDNSDPLAIPEDSFRSMFRLSRQAFKYLLEQVEDKYLTGVRLTYIPPLIKLAAVLRFFAEGAYQKGAGNDLFIGIAQSTFSLILKETVNIFEQHVCPNWIKSEMNETEKDEAKLHYFLQTGFPGVIGCVDGTHVRILPPSIDVRHLYYNRKGFYSLNVMIKCDHKLRVRYINAKYPGSTHDSTVWNMTALKPFLKTKYEAGDKNTHILGDSGYPLEPYLITPFRNTTEGSNQAKFNTIHAKTRNCVERTIEVLKNRFRCILGARELHYIPEKAAQIVNCCAALHNICVHYRIALEIDEEIEIIDMVDIVNMVEEQTTGQNIRNAIMNSMNF